MEDVRIEHRYNASHFKLDNHYENVYQMLLICQIGPGLPCETALCFSEVLFVLIPVCVDS